MVSDYIVHKEEMPLVYTLYPYKNSFLLLLFFFFFLLHHLFLLYVLVVVVPTHSGALQTLNLDLISKYSHMFSPSSAMYTIIGLTPTHHQ